MKKIQYIIVAVITLLINSCDTIHEYPNETPHDPTQVNVNLRLTVNATTLKDKDFGGSKSEGISDDQILRAVIEIYKYTDKNNYFLRKEIPINANSPEIVINEKFALNATKYRFVVWLDYVDKYKGEDQHYITSTNLRTVAFNEPFVANTDSRDCFFGNASVDLTQYQNQWDITVPLEINLTRPVAKYMLITNDIEKFMDNAINKGQVLSRADINKFSAKVFYQGFAPSGFDAYDNQLNDAVLGLWYYATLELLNDNEAMICFNYPLSNVTGSQVSIGMQLFNEKGEMINEVGDVKLPVTRGAITTMRSDFLTRSYSPGISIDPGYDGEIEVVLPD